MSSVIAELRSPSVAPTAPLSIHREPPFGDLAAVHQGLADLCRAGVPLSRALRVLRGDVVRGRMARCLNAIAEDLDRGEPFAEAYRTHMRGLSPVYGALLEVGMNTGTLPDVLDEISAHASERAKVLDKLRRSLTYPIVAAGFVVLVGIALVTVLDPSQLGSDLNGDLLSGAGLAAAGVAAVYLLSRLSPNNAEVPPPPGWRFRVPLFGKLRLLSAQTTFASTLAMLMRRDTPLPRALELTRESIADRGVRSRVTHMVDAAESGASLAESLAKGRLISEGLSWFLESAPDRHDSGGALADIARIYRRRLERLTDRITSLAAPLAQLLIGLVVLGFAMSYMSSTFQELPSVDSHG